MQELYVALKVVLAILLALGRNAAAEADCHLPEDNDIRTITTYTSAVTTCQLDADAVCVLGVGYVPRPISQCIFTCSVYVHPTKLCVALVIANKY